MLSHDIQATVENREDPNQLADLDSQCFQDNIYLGLACVRVIKIISLLLDSIFK